MIVMTASLHWLGSVGFLVLVIVVVAFAYYLTRGTIRHSVRKGVTVDEETTSHAVITRRSVTRANSQSSRSTCNEMTSSSVRTVDAAGHTRYACRCHWPTLFGQKDLFSDCNVHHACDGGKGVLVHRMTRRLLASVEPPIDIHDYVCSSCDRCNVPGPDPHTGLPSCIPRPFNDRDRDMCLYDVPDETDVYVGDTGADDATDGERYTTKPILSLRSRFVDERFVSSFTDRVRETAWVPNPCAYDLFTGSRLDGGCQLRLTRKTNVAYCAPIRDNIMTAVKEDSYLVNNRGAYPNACFRFTSNEHHVNGYVIEYFLRERRASELPSPVVSMRIARDDVLGSVVAGLGLKNVPKEKMLLFTQPEPPPDVDEFPHPFNKRGMTDFTKERNHWLDALPAKCSKLFVQYNCSAPVQALPITECSRIGDTDRDPSDKRAMPGNGILGDQTDVYAESTVACRNPEYDKRFPIVPNYRVAADSTDSALTSAILFFDKTTNTVYPHWKEVGENVSGEVEAIRRYVREQLRSAPNETIA